MRTLTGARQSERAACKPSSDRQAGPDAPTAASDAAAWRDLDPSEWFDRENRYSLEGFEVIIIESNADYIPIINARLAHAEEMKRDAERQLLLFVGDSMDERPAIYPVQLAMVL
jgi:hypothetical protein